MITIIIIGTIITTAVYWLGLPGVIIGISIGMFFFVGAPIYRLLNFVEKIKTKILNNLMISNCQKKYDKYEKETLETYKKMYG